MRRILIAVALLTVLPSTAWAQRSNLYGGFAAGGYVISPPGNNDESNTTDLGLRLGYHFTNFIGIEGRLGANAHDVTNSNSNSVPDASYGGVFARFDLPFHGANVYALLGAADVSLDGHSVTDQRDATSGGIGIELYGNESTALSLEYMSYCQDSYHGLSIGFVHHFGLPSLR